MTRRARIAAGFSYVEVLLAMAILAGAVASMSFALGNSRDTNADADRFKTALYLVDDGLAWVMSLHRRDPESPTSFGVESGETAATFDDVDDLSGYTETTVADRTGTVFSGGWTRVFAVEPVDVANPIVVVAAGSTALLRVTVSVRHGDEIAKESVLLWSLP
jgi:type II secretory pathway pseudopilin PulG